MRSCHYSRTTALLVYIESRFDNYFHCHRSHQGCLDTCHDSKEYRLRRLMTRTIGKLSEVGIMILLLSPPLLQISCWQNHFPILWDQMAAPILPGLDLSLLVHGPAAVWNDTHSESASLGKAYTGQVDA